MSEPTTLVAPDGQRFDVPTPDGVAALKAKGFRDLNEAERKDVALQHKFGEGVLPAVGAAASGAASALTFGGSDVLANAMGGDVAEANRELAARNPTAHTVGQIGALALPIVGELAGASAAGRAAQSAGGAITAVGKASQAAGGVAKTAAEALGAKTLAPIVGGAVQGGLEGAAFQVGSNLGEIARRDAKLDAETLLAHAGEAAILGGGIGAALPAAAAGARWTADKALSGIEQGVQGLRKLGFAVGDVGLDAIETGAGAVERNAGTIGAGVANAARGAAGLVDSGAAAIAGKADAIGSAVEGAGRKVADAVDEHLLPKIREGLTAQTGRPDIINDVFATGPEGAALRKELGSQTLTGTREMHAEELNKSLDDIWKASRGNEPMISDMAKAMKEDLQRSSMAETPLTRRAQKAVVTDVIGQANKTLEELSAVSPNSAREFQKAITNFGREALTNPSTESLYFALDNLKRASSDIAGFEKKAAVSGSSASIAERQARDFYSFAQKHLENAEVWGAAGPLQLETNAVLTRAIRAMDDFKATFGAKGAKGQFLDVLSGDKIEKWARDIAGLKGQVKNAVIDNLIRSQRDVVELTSDLAAKSQDLAKAQLASHVAQQSTGRLDALQGAATTATKSIDRAEVLQQTQSAILSRQGAGVNPLPVEALKGLGGGALVGGIIGGAPGAIAGGAVTSVLQKYGAITTNPKSAIEFLNTIERLRGVDKERIATWLKSTMQDAGTGAKRLAERVDEKKIAEAVRRGAESTREAIPRARAGLASANEAAARKILDARKAAQRGTSTMASRMNAATPGLMRRILPAVSYADVANSHPEEWWKRTQKALTQAQSDPTAFSDKLHDDTQALRDTLPAQADAIHEQQMRVLGYLSDHMPRDPRPYMLGSKPWQPSSGDLKAFRDLTLVATKPDALLPLITMGVATRTQVDAVRELWPKRFEAMKAQIVGEVVKAASDGHPVPYKARLRLGQLLGVPLDPSQEPGFAEWMQTTTTTQPAQDDQQSSTVGGNLNLHSDEGLPLSARGASPN